MVRQSVEIKGVSGTVTVDHQDGTYTVNLVNHTIYLATEEEIATTQEDTPVDSKRYIETILDRSEANFLDRQLLGNAYRGEKKQIRIQKCCSFF